MINLTWTVFNAILQITSEKLHQLFSEKGIVTDVQLKYTKDGKFRHFGFVGFKTEEEAQNSVEYFNNTCVKASRIRVELCAGLGKWHIIDFSLNISVGVTCPYNVSYVFFVEF
jgi:RNA recognition motif-containing protein